jgi:hypothetical protein
MARPVGSLGSKTLQAITSLSEKGCDPLAILADIAMGTKIKCGLAVDGLPFEVEVTPSLEQRKDAAKELCQYIYPKRKAVEHSGIDGDEIVITQIRRVIVDSKNDDSINKDS